MSSNFKSAIYLFVVLILFFVISVFLNIRAGNNSKIENIDCLDLSGAELFLKCGKQNINLINQETLSAIPGISDNLAKEIFLKRTETAGFKSWNEVDIVKGVGEKRIIVLKNYLFIDSRQ